MKFDCRGKTGVSKFKARRWSWRKGKDMKRDRNPANRVFVPLDVYQHLLKEAEIGALARVIFKTLDGGSEVDEELVRKFAELITGDQYES